MTVVWCVVFGVWSAVCGVWCVVCGVWCVVVVLAGPRGSFLSSFPHTRVGGKGV